MCEKKKETEQSTQSKCVGAWMAPQWSGERILKLDSFLDIIVKHGT